MYKSPFGENGFNVALFEINTADCINGFLYEAKSMDIEFEETANPYFVTPKTDVPEKEQGE